MTLRERLILLLGGTLKRKPEPEPCQHGSFYGVCKTCPPCYDCYLLDTWQGTNEGTWWREVMPQRRAIRNRFGTAPAIHCWAEDIMLGQIMRTLQIGKPHWYYEHLPLPMSARDAKQFVTKVGLPAWEKKYGAAVDAAIKEQNEVAEAFKTRGR